MTSIVLELKECVDSLKNSLTKENQMREPFVSILEELYGITESLQSPAIAENLDNYALQISSPVEKYGVGSKVITLAEEGKSSEEISISLAYSGVTIDKKDISKWLKQYEGLSTSEKIESSRGSIFDTQYQLQEVFERLHSLMESVENKEDNHYYKGKTIKEQVILDVVKEIRQSVKDASQLASTVASMQSVENFQKIVVEEVSKVDPDVAQTIWRRLKEAKSFYNSMNLV
jgi:hypothetical protein